jgi:hypothetical protein
MTAGLREGHPNGCPSRVASVTLMIVVVMMMMVTVHSRRDANINASAVMVVVVMMMMMMMMMMSDYDLRGPCAVVLCQALIVGFQ